LLERRIFLLQFGLYQSDNKLLEEFSRITIILLLGLKQGRNSILDQERANLKRQSGASVPTKYLFVEKVMKMTKKGIKWFDLIYEINDVRSIHCFVNQYSPKTDDALNFS